MKKRIFLLIFIVSILIQKPFIAFANEDEYVEHHGLIVGGEVNK
ncbi:hypothetical protein [Neofamilia massiliensis]|nr:hypothetical protein [Neofamilia massiliensis]